MAIHSWAGWLARYTRWCGDRGMGVTKQRVVACTIIAHNYLPQARLVAQSFLDHHPDARFVVAVIDRFAECQNLRDECFEVLPISSVDFGPEGHAYMATAYNVTEFATATKPFVLRHLVNDADCVLYLDPDIYVYSNLDALIDATIRAGWSLTPHCLQPIVRSGAGPTEAEIMAAGAYNLGYIGVTSSAIGFLEWWGERLRRDAIIDPPNQLFTDQRWIDLAVPIFSPYIERSPAYNVAYWNLDQRRFWFDADGVPMVDDERLRFFHFSGFAPKNPHWLSKYQPRKPRVLLSDQPDVGRLCEDYAEQMIKHSVGSGPIASYGWSEACVGMPLDNALRRRYRAELIASDTASGPRPPTPFLPGGLSPFLLWLTTVPDGSARRLPRYLEMVWESRTDLIEHFPEVEKGNADNYLRWVRRSGRYESALINFLGLPLPVAPLGSQVADLGREPGGVDLIGYFHAELGVGEAGRLLRTGLEAGGVPTETIACRGTLSRQKHDFEASGVARFDTTILSVNADQFSAVREEFGRDFFDGRYVIGQWFWEVEQFPRIYHHAFSLVDEVWVATEHIRRSLLSADPEVPVKLMPLPLLAPEVDSDVSLATFGLDDRFTFLFTWDMFSIFARKNPLGVVKAFANAFAPNEGPRLVLKTINGSHRREDMERLRFACRRRPDITIIDGYLDAGRAAGLMAACDCYVSLHRAEGLGLTMSEAMALKKPVIATAYSGNMDFMTPDTAYLVPWEPVDIGADAAPYPAGASWAEPDLDAASTLMRDVYADPAASREVGARAARDLSIRFSTAAVGRRMSKRLEEIREIRNA